MATPDAGNPSARLSHEGRHRHYWTDTIIDNLAVVDLSLLTAADTFDFSRYVPKDGVTGDPTLNNVESDDITEVFNSQGAGDWSWEPELSLYMQDPEKGDQAFDYFRYGRMGTWIELWAADENSPKDGDAAYVRLVESHVPVPLPFTRNQRQRFRLKLAIVSQPEFAATVVAGS